MAGGQQPDPAPPIAAVPKVLWNDRGKGKGKVADPGESVPAPAPPRGSHLQISDGGPSHQDIQDSSAPPWVNDLVLTSRAKYVPLMLRDVDKAYELMDDEFKLYEYKVEWQKDKLGDKRVLGHSLSQWTRTDVKDRPESRPDTVARALMRYGVPNSNPLRHVDDLRSSTKGTYAFCWKQDQPLRFNHPTRGSVSLVSD